MTCQWLGLILLYVATVESLTPQGCKGLKEIKQLDADWGFNRIMYEAEFGHAVQYKELFCCGENYDSLIWTFRGDQDTTEKPYPWFGPLIANDYNLNPAYKNQSLELKHIRYKDQGKYTCTMRKGDQASRSHSVVLTVAPTDGSFSGQAQMTTRPTDMTTPIGSNVTFECEGYFGTAENPIEPGKKIEWHVTVSDEPYRWVTEPQFPRYHEQKTYRNNRLYMGSNLTITDIQEEDYDAIFRCIVTNDNGSPQTQTVRLLRPDPPLPPIHVEGPYKMVLVGLACALGSVIVLTAVMWNYRLELRIFLRDKFSKSELLGDITHSAFLVYSEDSEDDSNFVTNTLLEAVEDKMGYSVLISDRDFLPGTARAEEYVRCMDASARFVVILSPDFLNDTWCDFALNVALEREKNIVFILYRDIENWDEYRNQRIMKSIVSIKRTIKWPVQGMQRKLNTFYNKLHLQLPPQPSEEAESRDLTGTSQNQQLEHIVIQVPPVCTNDESDKKQLIVLK